MKILENHNRKLEAHIERLRYYKDNHADFRVGDAGQENNFGTLQAKSIVPSDLFTDDPSTDDGENLEIFFIEIRLSIVFHFSASLERQKRPPPTSAEFVDSGAGKVSILD